MSHSSKLVSVIIVNYNGLKYLGNCLDSVFRTTYPTYEIILVDNHSSDGSLEIAKKYRNLILIENEENKGFAEGCNQGIAIAKGDYITLLNPDTIVNAQWLDDLVTIMESDSSIGITQSKLMLMNKEGILDDTGVFLDPNGFFVHPGLLKKDEGQFDKLFPIFSAKGAAMTIRGSTLKEIGLLDADFFAYLEESDLCWRAWLRNYRVIYVPTSIVYHAWGGSLPSKKSMQFLLYLGTRNRIMMLFKNLQSRNLPTILLRNILANILISVFFAKNGKYDECGMIWKGIFWNMRHFRETFRKRSAVQKIRKVSDKYLFTIIMKRQSIFELYRYHNEFVKPNLSDKKYVSNFEY